MVVAICARRVEGNIERSTPTVAAIPMIFDNSFASGSRGPGLRIRRRHYSDALDSAGEGAR